MVGAAAGRATVLGCKTLIRGLEYSRGLQSKSSKTSVKSLLRALMRFRH